jgi:hypothetical protein
MFTRGIIYDGIKYIECINDIKDIRMKSLEDFVYCILVEIEMNVNDEDFALEAENYMNKLTNFIKFPRNNNFSYANILNDKIFLSEFTEWLKCIDSSFFDFQSIAIYDTTVDLIDYIIFDKWMIDLENLKKKLCKRLYKLENIKI